MTRSLFRLVAIATTCLYFATAVLALGIPAGLAKNASQDSIPAEVAGTNLGLQARLVRGISDELFHTFQLMAQYSAAAYCKENDNSTDTPITCWKGNCPLVEEAGARSVLEFENTPINDDTGFLAVDETNRLIVLAFRGTHSLDSLAVDLDYHQVDSDLCAKCSVHKGFGTAWQQMRDQITTQVLDTIKAHPDFRFAITGHSLGGVLATLAAGALRNLNDDLRERTELYSFGAPRLGNLALADYLTQQSNRSHRITNRADWVPRLPPHTMHYHHTYPEYFISHHSDNPSPKNFRIVVRNDYKGNAYTANPLTGWKKHDSYFMKHISGCWVPRPEGVPSPLPRGMSFGAG